MPDYGADPLWDLATEAMVSLDRLSISEQIRALVRGWSARWESLARQDMAADDYEAGMTDTPASSVPAAAWAELNREGRELWLRLRSELGDGFEVGWCTLEQVRCVQWEPDGSVEPCPPPGAM